MKYVFQYCRILVFCLIGEVLHHLTPLPVSASIYGLVPLLAALKIGIVRFEQVKEERKLPDRDLSRAVYFRCCRDHR